MQTLLIADSNDAFRQQLAEAFQPYYHVLTCRNGLEALDILCREHCECLVLELTLPELDGITMLEMAVAHDIRPVVLAVSPLFTSYAFDVAESLGIGYMIRKPCHVQTVVARMLDLKRRLKPVWASREQISRFLLWLGVPTGYDGYEPLVEALVLLAEDPRQPITKLDFYTCGLSGQPDSKARRQALKRRLGLPEHLSSNGLLEAIGLLYDREEFLALMARGDLL